MTTLVPRRTFVSICGQIFYRTLICSITTFCLLSTAPAQAQTQQNPESKSLCEMAHEYRDTVLILLSRGERIGPDTVRITQSIVLKNCPEEQELLQSLNWILKNRISP